MTWGIYQSEGRILRIIARLCRNGTCSNAHAMEKSAWAFDLIVTPSVRRCGSAAYTQFRWKNRCATHWIIWTSWVCRNNKAWFGACLTKHWRSPLRNYQYYRCTSVSLPVHLTEKRPSNRRTINGSTWTKREGTIINSGRVVWTRAIWNKRLQLGVKKMTKEK